MSDDKGSNIYTGGGGYTAGSVYTGGGDNAGNTLNKTINNAGSAPASAIDVAVALRNLKQSIEQMPMGENKRADALARYDLLADELGEEDGKPSTRTVMRIGDWFMDNLPELASALKNILTTPQVVQAAGFGSGIAMAWLQTHFG